MVLRKSISTGDTSGNFIYFKQHYTDVEVLFQSMITLLTSKRKVLNYYTHKYYMLMVITVLPKNNNISNKTMKVQSLPSSTAARTL